MRELSVGKIRRSLKRFEDFAGDLARSDMNTFEDRLRLLMDYCETDPVLSVIHLQLLAMPGVDFDSWYSEALSTKGGMAGSGDLKFPTDLEKRMATMYQLLSRVNKEEIGLMGLARNFFITGDNRIDSMIFAFNDAVVEPLTRELSYRIEDLVEEMPEDSHEIYSLANIQIIHSAENVVQQSASGRNIQQTAVIEGGDHLADLFKELRQELQRTIETNEELEQALQVVQSSEEIAKQGSSSYPSVSVLLGSLRTLGNIGSIVSAILAGIASVD